MAMKFMTMLSATLLMVGLSASFYLLSLGW